MHIDLVRDRSMMSALRGQPERLTPRRPWLRLLSEVLKLAGDKAEFLRHSERPWASATFSGSRHRVLLVFMGHEAIAQGETFISALPDHEFTIPGHLVADATVVSVDHENGPVSHMTVEAELLLLEDL